MIDQFAEEVVIYMRLKYSQSWLECLGRQRVSIAVLINTCVLKDL